MMPIWHKVENSCMGTEYMNESLRHEKMILAIRTIQLTYNCIQLSARFPLFSSSSHKNYLLWFGKSSHLFCALDIMLKIHTEANALKTKTKRHILTSY